MSGKQILVPEGAAYLIVEDLDNGKTDSTGNTGGVNPAIFAFSMGQMFASALIETAATDEEIRNFIQESIIDGLRAGWEKGIKERTGGDDE